MTVETTHRATLELGPSVVNGRLIWTSASGLMAGDPQSSDGCPRRWWFEQVEGRKQPSTAAQKRGTDLHSEIEDYLLRGESLKSPLALSGARFLDKPGADLMVETPLVVKQGASTAAWLTVGNVFLAGHVDLWNHRGHYVNEEAVLTPDAPKTLETKDYKSTKDFKYAKAPAELANNLQLVTYAEAGFRMWPHLEHARLTHIYFRTHGAPASKLVTIRRTREQIATRWKYAESVVRLFADIAGETNADKVPPNVKACGAYGGCPHRSYCNGFKTNSLDDVFAKIAADFGPQEDSMGLLDTLPKQDVKTQLAQEEAQLRAQQQIIQADPLAGFLDAWRKIESYKKGTPALGGQAAQAYGVAMGRPMPPHTGIAGTGYLGGISLMDPAQVFQLADELAQGPAPNPVPPPAPAPIAPPPAPIAPPAPPAAVMAPPTPVAQMISILPPDAGVSPPAPPAAAEPPTVGTPVPPPPPPKPPKPPIDPNAPKRKVGRPPKNPSGSSPSPALTGQAQTAPDAGPSTTAGDGSQVVSDGEAPTFSEAEELNVFVDCMASWVGVNETSMSLTPYVEGINRELAAKYCVDETGKPTIQDIRCAPKNSVLAFGGWKGAVFAVVQSHPPLPGDYHLDTRGNEIAEIVADALRSVADLYVRSTR